MRRRYMIKGCATSPDANTLLLLHFDNNLFDEISHESALVDTPQSYEAGKFNKAVCLNNNAIQYKTSNIDFSGDWTIDFWWQDKGTGLDLGLFTNSSYAWLGWTCRGISLRWMRDASYYNQNIFRAYFLTPSHQYNEEIADWAPPSYNYFKDKMHHIGMVKHGTTGYFFVDGILRASRTALSKNDPLCENLTIGKWNNYSTVGNNIGIFDEFRISNIARWTSNFTPSTKPY